VRHLHDRIQRQCQLRLPRNGVRDFTDRPGSCPRLGGRRPPRHVDRRTLLTKQRCNTCADASACTRDNRDFAGQRRNSLHHYCSFHRFLSSMLISFYFCDARFSRLPALSPLALRFIAAIISTSPSVKPRVVILHITASQLTRSIASLLKARAVPNVVAHVTAGKERGFAEFRSGGKCRKPKLSILPFGGLAETVAGRNI
jgi:hypothetical protein